MPNQETNIKLQAEISASANGLVSALNQATSAINGTTGDWQTKFSQLKDSTSLISQSVKNLGDLMGKVDSADMGQLETSLGEVQEAFNRVQGEVSEFANGLAKLKNEASDLGMPVDDYQRFADAVKNANMSIEQGQNAIRAMQKNIADFANGVPEAKSMFDTLGISLEQLGSNSVMGNFAAIQQAIQGVVPSLTQASTTMQMFGTNMQDTMNVAKEYDKILANQANNQYATDKDIQNVISLNAAIGKMNDQFAKVVEKQKEAIDTNSAYQTTLGEILWLNKQVDNEIGDLYASYATYVDSLKKTVTTTLDSTRALEIFSDKVKKSARDVRDTIDTLKKRAESESTPTTKVTYKMPFVGTEIDKLVQFMTKAKQKLGEEMVAITAIMNQRIDAGAPIDTKEVDVAINHVGKLAQSLEELNKLIEEAQANDVVVSQENLDALEELDMVLQICTNNLEGFKRTATQTNVEMGVDELVDQLGLLEEKFDRIREEGGVIDTQELDEAQKKLNGILKTIGDANVQIDVDTLPIKDLQTEIDNLRDEINVMAYDAEKNGFETLYDGAKKFGNALRHPISETKNLRDRLRELGSKSLSAAKNGVIEIGKAFVHPIEQAQKLKDKMDEFVASTHKAKNAVDSIGNGSGGMKDNMGKTAANAKQALGQIMGMGGKLGFIVWAGKTFLGSLKMWVQGFTEANKQARELQETLSKQQTEVAQGNEKRADSLADDLKKYAELREKVGKDNKATDKDELVKLQREIEAKYGVDLKDGAKEFREAFQWADNMKKDAIESQIASLEKLNKALRDEDTELQSTWKNFLNHGVSSSGWKQVYDRRSEIQNTIGDNASKIAELRNRLRVEQSKNGLSDWRTAQNAKKQDELTKAREDQKKVLDEATKKLNEWAFSLNANDRQKNLKEIMQKYEEAVKGGVSKEKARVVAVQAINDMLKKEREDEKKNEELLKAMDERIKAYKSAYKAYVEADKQVRDAKKEYAQTQKELADEAKSERIAKRRERLQKAMGRFGFSPYEGFKFDESSSERRERRRNAQIDASIADKMAKSQSGKRVTWTHSEKERLAQFNALQRKDKQLEASQKAMEAADKQKKAAEALQDAARAIREAMFGRGDAGKNLRDAGKDLREASKQRRTRSRNLSADKLFEGAKKGLTAKGIGGALQQRSQNYNGQLTQLHKDLQGMAKRVYVVK